MSLPSQPLRVSLIQGNTRWHDAAANRAYYGALVRGLREPGDLVVLPETFTSGFTNEALGNAQTMQGESLAWLRALAGEVGAVLTGSLVVREGDACVNRLVWMRPDGSFDVYDKRHLFRMAGEHKHYAAGDEQVLLDVKGWQVRPLICYDLRFPVWSRDPHNTDLLLYTANWPGARRHHWNRLLPARAIENLCYVAAVNRIGTDGKGHSYTGDSQVLDFQGESLLAPGAAAGVFRVSLSARELAAYRERFPAHLDADAFALT